MTTTWSTTINLIGAENSCAVCSIESSDLVSIENLDADLVPGETPLYTKLTALANNKNVSGQICGSCIERAKDAWQFQQQLQASQAEPSLSDKIRVLRQRLRELTDKVKVYIVIGPEKTDGQSVYTEENIVVVDKTMLGETEEEVETTQNENGVPIYQCTVCPESFQQLSNYMEHTQSHPADALHTCWVCGKQFRTRLALKQHKSAHFDIEGFVCKMCHVLFQSQADMNSHRCGTTCPSCSAILPDKVALSAHVKEHHSVSGKPPYVCSVCMEVFTMANKLQLHSVKHNTTTQYVCGYDRCIQRFTTRASLASHVRREHATESAVVTCGETGCVETFTTASGLQAHTSQAHNTLRCTICNHLAMTTAGLRKHMKAHIEVKEPRAKKARGRREVGRPVAQPSTEEELVTDLEQIYNGSDQPTILIQEEDLPDGEYALAVDVQEMEMMEEEVEYLEVETLEEDLEEHST